jgi:hypothetical protein
LTHGWWWLWIPFGVVGLFGLVWIAAGAGQMYKYPSDDTAEDDADGDDGISLPTTE